MIVRLMGEGQYRVDDALIGRLNELDAEVSRAVDEGDERALWTGLQALADAVREGGEKLADEDLRPVRRDHPARGPVARGGARAPGRRGVHPRRAGGVAVR